MSFGVSAWRVRVPPRMDSSSPSRSITSRPMEVASWNLSGCSVRLGERVSVCRSGSSRRTTELPFAPGANSTR